MADKAPPFDPKKPFKVVGDNGGDQPPPFDPKKPFNIVGAPKTGNEAQTALESFGNAATLGYLPQAQAGFQKIVEGVGGAVAGGIDTLLDKAGLEKYASPDHQLKKQGFTLPPEETYTEARDRNIKRQKTQAEENPWSSLGGTVAGAVSGSTLLPLGKFVKSASFLPSWKAATLGRGAEAALVGAGLGAATNPGDVEGEINPLQLNERIDNAKMGAAVGVAAQGLTEVGTKAIKFVGDLPEKLKNYAEEKAFKATGANKRDFIKAMGKGKLQEIGRVMIDEGILEPGASLDDIAAAAVKLKALKGEEIGTVLKQLAQDEIRYGGAGVQRTDIAKELSDELLKPNQGISTIAERNSKFETLINNFGNHKEPLTIPKLQEIKQTLKGEINWNRLPDADIPDNEVFYRSLYGKVSKALEDRAEDIANRSGMDAYKSLKRVYGAAADIENITSRSLAGQKANRLFSASDYGTAGAGALLGAATGDNLEDKVKNAAIGAGLGIGNKIFRQYGNPLLAQVADKVSQILSRNPEFFGPYAVPLTESLQNGVGSYATTLTRLMSDQKFVAKLDESEEQSFASQSKPKDAIGRALETRKSFEDKKAKEKEALLKRTLAR